MLTTMSARVTRSPTRNVRLRRWVLSRARALRISLLALVVACYE